MLAVQPILVVEDELLISLELVDALEAGGFTTAQSENGSSAIEHIDCCDELHGLITDIRLGNGPTGWDVARHARQKFPDIAVVYMSGDSAAEWPVEGVPKSIMLQKPFASAQLMTAISNLLIDAGQQQSPDAL